MDPIVMLVVLLAAAMHAGWNALIKSGEDKLLEMASIAAGGTLFAVVALPFLPAPKPAAYPYLATSGTIHIVYYWLLISAYRAGDMGLTYPIMRGGTPLVVAIVGGPLIGEHLGFGGWVGVFLLCGGVLALALDHRCAGGMAPVGYALANAVAIASYTVVDGLGSRVSESAAAYVLWLRLLGGPALFLWVFATRPLAVVARHAQTRWQLGLAGGLASSTTYFLVLWAMGHSPVAMVSALREIAIVFGAIIARVVLGERASPLGLAATGVMLAGAIALRLA